MCLMCSFSPFADTAYMHAQCEAQKVKSRFARQRRLIGAMRYKVVKWEGGGGLKKAGKTNKLVHLVKISSCGQKEMEVCNKNVIFWVLFIRNSPKEHSAQYFFFFLFSASPHHTYVC